MLRLPSPAAAVFTAALLLPPLPSGAAPVISEIMYRPGTAFPENTRLEFVEIHNPDAAPADLSGWGLTSGVDYLFPDGTILAPGGFLAVAADPVQLQALYPGLAAKGPWQAGSTLANNGEKITLSRPGAVPGAWVKVDEVTYASEGDWGQRIRETVFNGLDWTSPASAGGKSMELRNPALSNDSGQNWAPSTAAAGGTPGAANTAATASLPPVILGLKHAPALPRSSDPVTISCTIEDESPGVTATLFHRDATSTSPGAFLSTPMTADAGGKFTAVLPASPDKAITEFYVAATDAAGLTRTWPAPAAEGQIANCVYQVDDEIPSASADTYRLTLTAADNRSWENLSNSSDRQYNMTLIMQRGPESVIRYRASMRTRGNSSRGYQFRPLKVSIPNDDDWDGCTSFNLQPRSPWLQHLGMRLLQASGLAASDSIPVELRRNGVEYTTSSGSSADYGMWARVEPEGSEYVRNHWPHAATGNLYTKRSPERYWRSSGWTVPSTPDGLLDNWAKQNNGAANDWTDLTGFFTGMQRAAAPHFPGAPATDVSQSNGSRLSGIGAWNKTGLDVDGLDILQSVADTHQWARFFAAMTILQDYETNISNGVDDDYGIYFRPGPGNLRLAELVPHDLDTIVGLGDTPQPYNAAGLFDMTEGGSSGYAFRTLLPLVGTNSVTGNPDFRLTYFTELRTLFATVFNTDSADGATAPFYQFVDAHLTGWAPAPIIASIKEFVRQRRLYLLDLIPDGVTGGATATPLPPPAATSAATVTASHGAVILSEVLASNLNAHVNGGLSPDLIELGNTGSAPVNLEGMTLTDDPAEPAKFTFPAGTALAPGEFITVYADSAFTAPGMHTGFQLDQNGDAVYLYSSAAGGGALLDSVAFGLQATDYSLGRTGPGLNTWALCVPTAGAANTAVPVMGAPGGLSLNEWLASPGFRSSTEFLEVYNPSAAPVAMGGMRLTDDFAYDPTRFVLPPLSFAAPGSFTAFRAKGGSAPPGNATELPFSINSTFGFLSLAGSNGTIVDRVSIISQRQDESTGRSPDGTGPLAAFPLPTPGLPNAAPPPDINALLNSLRITEILYKPDGGSDYEFVELLNTGSLTLDLSGVRFTAGIDYTFPAGSRLEPGRYTVVCRNPAALLSRFPLAGPGLAPGQYTGALDNSGETLTLALPKPWDAAILNFGYKTSWEPLTFTAGYSLVVIDPAGTAARDWGERRTWTVAETPHGSPGGPGAPVITSPLSATAIRGDVFTLSITATRDPLLFRAAGLPAGLTLGETTGIISGTPAETGTFPVLLTASNAAGSGEATLTLTVNTSGPLHHFTWRAAPAAAETGIAFPAWITAEDAQGRTVTAYNGTAALTGTTTTGGISGSTVVITEVTDEDEDQFELQNTGASTVNTSGWYVALGHSSGINALNSITWALPASMTPGQTLRVSEYDQPGRLPFGGGISWTTAVARGWIMLFDAAGTPRDFFAWGWQAADLAALSVTVRGKPVTAAGQWTGHGSPLGTRVNGNDSWQRTGSKDTNTAADWTFASNAPSWSVSNPGLILPWAAPGTIAVNPATAGFTQGVFTGFLSLHAPATGVTLTAADTPSLSGTSGPFDVVPAAPDADGDGLPDAWESAHGLDPAVPDAAGDPDRDGFASLIEYHAGTHPLQAASRLSIHSVSLPAAGTAAVTWQAAAGRLYRVQWSSGTAAWQDVPGQLYAPAVSGPQSAVFALPPGLGDKGFFRVALLTPP